MLNSYENKKIWLCSFNDVYYFIWLSREVIYLSIFAKRIACLAHTSSHDLYKTLMILSQTARPRLPDAARSSVLDGNGTLGLKTHSYTQTQPFLCAAILLSGDRMMLKVNQDYGSTEIGGREWGGGGKGDDTLLNQLFFLISQTFLHLRLLLTCVFVHICLCACFFVGWCMCLCLCIWIFDVKTYDFVSKKGYLRLYMLTVQYYCLCQVNHLLPCLARDVFFTFESCCERLQGSV